MTIPTDVQLTPMARWENGNTLSAARLNVMIDNIDVLYGFDHTFATGWLNQLTRDSAMSNINNAPYWLGWVAKRGNVLKIFVEANDDLTRIYFPWGGDYQGETPLWSGYNHPADEFTLEIGNLNLVDYTIYPLLVLGNESPPRYAYLTDTSFAAGLGVILFPNGDTSAAANFNSVIERIETLAEYMTYPVGYDISERTVSDSPSQQEFVVYMPRRSAYFEWYGTAETGINELGGDTITWQTGTPGTGGIAWDAPFFSYVVQPTNPYAPTTRQVREITTAAKSFIPVRFKMTFDEASQEGRARMYWFGMSPDNGSGGGVTTANLTRWTAGNHVYGDSGGTPKLEDMDDVFAYLEGRVWPISPVCRDSFTNLRINDMPYEFWDRLFSRRVYRWLAYKSAGNSPTIQYSLKTDQNNVSGSVNLTTSPGETAYVDLDTTPIKQGMMMRFIDCAYAFQLPQKP